MSPGTPQEPLQQRIYRAVSADRLYGFERFILQNIGATSLRAL
jgi:hypothetical protein